MKDANLLSSDLACFENQSLCPVFVQRPPPGAHDWLNIIDNTIWTFSKFLNACLNFDFFRIRCILVRITSSICFARMQLRGSNNISNYYQSEPGLLYWHVLLTTIAPEMVWYAGVSCNFAWNPPCIFSPHSPTYHANPRSRGISHYATTLRTHTPGSTTWHTQMN